MMKKSILSLVSIMTLSGFSYAGGDMMKVVEPVIEIPEVVEKSFYVGVGLGNISVNDDTTKEEISATTWVFQAGYQVNDYLALEGRYSSNIGSVDYDAGNLTNTTDSYDGDLSTWGIYVKPIYPIGDFSLYALLGYGGVILEDLEGGDAVENSFHWGLGVSYVIKENVSVFADYVSLYDDKGFDYRAAQDDVDSSTWTVGLTFKF